MKQPSERTPRHNRGEGTSTSSSPGVEPLADGVAPANKPHEPRGGPTTNSLLSPPISALPEFLAPQKKVRQGDGLAAPIADRSAAPTIGQSAEESSQPLLRLKGTLLNQAPRILLVVLGFVSVAVGWQQLFGGQSGLASSSNPAQTNAVLSSDTDVSTGKKQANTAGSTGNILADSTGAAKSESRGEGIGKNPIESTEIMVDVSGAVTRSGVYSLPATARVSDAVTAAGGLHKSADAAFVQKQINLAAKLSDSQKIYIPFEGEAELELLVQELTAQLSPASSSPQGSADRSGGSAQTSNPLISSTPGGSGLISINTATQAELDSLPGIGTARATAIIEGRPYQSIEELLERKVLTQGIYTGIEELIGL